MNKNEKLAIAALCVIGGLILVRDPHCRKGCRTLAQHLVNHGVDELLAGLF